MRFYNRLYFRFFCIFGITSSVLVLFVGVVFLRLYNRHVIDDFRTQLEIDANEISDRIEDYSIAEEIKGYIDYMDATQALLKSQDVDIWVMPYHKAQNKLKKKYTNNSIRYNELSDGMKKVMKRIYKNDKVYSNYGYDSIYEMELIRAGAPIHDAGGNVIGGVLLNADSSVRSQTVVKVKNIVILSLVSAWLLSIAMAVFFSRSLSGPISRVRQTAVKLADGEYTAKSGIKVRGEIGELARTVDILADRLVENEKIREELDKSRMDFFANVSHELRTPITVMRGYTETLNDGIIVEEKKRKITYEKMLNECKGMERLVGDLLTLSKMQNADFELNTDIVSVVQIFEDVVRGAKVLSKEKNILINTHFEDEYGFMKGDYDRLRQMFLIILDNAIKFSHENSEIDIYLKKEDKLYISIQDYGVGIDDDMLPYIFEKFYKSKLRMNEKGSGLGLVIARQIAIRHNGIIDVESVPGKGTTFKFEFESAEPPEF